MLKKLIENWLDSASERTYQPIFCQILMNEGYTVVHSTRHTPEEYGKDVIAIAPDGIVCAYQLKGNPKSRLTLSQYRAEVAPQLRELVTQRIESPAIKKGTYHRSYLVTNGEIEELVQQAIEQENEKNREDGYPNRKLETVARGQLLSWANRLEFSLWPSELEDTKILLEIFTLGGENLFPVDKFHMLLSNLLCLTDSKVKLTTSEQRRRISSSALLTAICLKPFSEKNNHWAMVTAWTMFSTYLISFIDMYESDLNIDDQLQFSKEIIFDEIHELLAEALERPNRLSEGEPLSDFAVYSWRYTLLVSISSFYYLFANKDRRLDNDDFKKSIEDFLPNNLDELDVWGEAALLQALFYLWAIELRDDKKYSGEMKLLLEKSIKDNLACVYNTADEVIRHRLSEVLEDFRSPIEEELSDKVGTSWFSMQLLLHMVKRQEKSECIELWRDFSKTNSAFFIPESKWEFCLYKSKSGQNMTYIPKDQETWAELEKLANNSAKHIIPEAMMNNAWVLSLWMLICPQRALPEAINHVYSSLVTEGTS